MYNKYLIQQYTNKSEKKKSKTLCSVAEIILQYIIGIFCENKNVLKTLNMFSKSN